jgi:hypothetical protein
VSSTKVLSPVPSVPHRLPRCVERLCRFSTSSSPTTSTSICVLRHGPCITPSTSGPRILGTSSTLAASPAPRDLQNLSTLVLLVTAPPSCSTAARLGKPCRDAPRAATNAAFRKLLNNVLLMFTALMCCAYPVNAGSLVLRMVLQSLLPNFLDLLVVDYNRWAEQKESRDEPAGSLITQ